MLDCTVVPHVGCHGESRWRSGEVAMCWQTNCNNDMIWAVQWAKGCCRGVNGILGNWMVDRLKKVLSDRLLDCKHNQQPLRHRQEGSLTATGHTQAFLLANRVSARVSVKVHLAKKDATNIGALNAPSRLMIYKRLHPSIKCGLL